jgi:CheY-like chemotaxis protein
VLVVEDDGDLRRIFRDSLRFAGFDVVEAGDGPDALQAIENATPDLVVLDLGLPTLDGVSVRDEIVSNPRTRHIPVLIVTGTQADANRLKAARVLRKPVGPDALLIAVQSCLASVM